MSSQTKFKEVDSMIELNNELLSELHDGITMYSQRFTHA